MNFADCSPTPDDRRRALARLFRLIAVCLVCAAMLGLGGSSSVLAVGDDDDRDSGNDRGNARVNNVVYVQANHPDRGQNSILAYRRDSRTGCLTQFASFLTGGEGALNLEDRLGTDDHDQDIIVSPDKRFLFATNQGSNTIAVFRIRPNGNLNAVPGSPFPSGGRGPVSLALTDDYLYVVNQNEDPGQLPNNARPNYTVLRVDQKGRLTPLPDSTVRLNRGDTPTQGVLSPDGRFLFGNNFFARPYEGALAPFLPARSSELESFRIRNDGRLERVAGFPQALPVEEAMFVKPEARYSLGLQVHPTRRILYVGFLLGFKLGVYTYNNAGVLQFVRAAPLSDQGICWIVINKDRTRLYASNAITNSISVLNIENPLRPFQIQSLSLKLEDDAPTGPFPPVAFAATAFQIALSPDSDTLYVKTQDTTPQGYAKANALHILRVKPNGELVERSCSPVFLPIPPNAHAGGIVAL